MATQSKMEVVLLRHTPEPETVIATAAKLCYSSADIEKLLEKIEAKDQTSFIQKLRKLHHMSPFEHATATFAVEGISRACSHQLVRHRIASYSQQSQRYVSEASGFDYIVPPSIASNPIADEYFSKFMEQCQTAYQTLQEQLNAMGYKGEAANQDARYVLPNAAETKIIVTMNFRELLESFFLKRCCNRAQWEIREMAIQMLRVIKPIAPHIFAEAGPGCMSGRCPEGDMTCGKYDDVRSFFARL